MSDALDCNGTRIVVGDTVAIRRRCFTTGSPGYNPTMEALDGSTYWVRKLEVRSAGWWAVYLQDNGYIWRGTWLEVVRCHDGTPPGASLLHRLVKAYRT